MKFVFLSLTLLSSMLSRAAMVSCGPSSCVPACGSSCSYSLCDGVSSFTKTINKLPEVINDQSSDSCNFTLDNLTKLPFNVSGTDYKILPANVTKQYNVCKTYTNTGSACP